MPKPEKINCKPSALLPVTIKPMPVTTDPMPVQNVLLFIMLPKFSTKIVINPNI